MKKLEEKDIEVRKNIFDLAKELAIIVDEMDKKRGIAPIKSGEK